MFEQYCTVLEADIMTDKAYGFVHVDAGLGKDRVDQIIRFIMFQTNNLNLKFKVWLTEILYQSFVLYTEVFDINIKVMIGGNKY